MSDLKIIHVLGGKTKRVSILLLFSSRPHARKHLPRLLDVALRPEPQKDSQVSGVELRTLAHRRDMARPPRALVSNLTAWNLDGFALARVPRDLRRTFQ